MLIFIKFLKITTKLTIINIYDLKKLQNFFIQKKVIRCLLCIL